MNIVHHMKFFTEIVHIRMLTKCSYQTFIRKRQQKRKLKKKFLRGPPSNYYPGATMLNFRKQTTTVVVIVVCWHTDMIPFSLLLFCIYRSFYFAQLISSIVFIIYRDFSILTHFSPFPPKSML